MRLANHHHQKSPAALRVLLDTNVWFYIVEAKTQSQLLSFARHPLIQVQVAPSIVYEVLSYSNLSVRNDVVRLLTHPAFDRLMPEAYSESMEILGEMRRLRPEWARPSPDLRFFEHSKKDWSRQTGGFWVRCARTPDEEARWRAKVAGARIAFMKEDLKSARRSMHEAKGVEPKGDLPLVYFDKPVKGWRGDPVEVWRFDSFLRQSFGLANVGDPYRDWIAPFIDVDHGLLDTADWAHFWLYEADIRKMPRQWLRSTHSFAQQFRKVTEGSPADEAVFSHLAETDVIITADKALVQIMNDYRKAAPFDLPDGKVIRARRGCLERRRKRAGLQGSLRPAPPRPT